MREWMNEWMDVIADNSFDDANQYTVWKADGQDIKGGSKNITAFKTHSRGVNMWIAGNLCFFENKVALLQKSYIYTITFIQ